VTVNPNGVADTAPRPKPQPRWRLVAQFTQGSSRLATLGWRTQSRWDWETAGGLVGNGKPLGRAGVREERSGAHPKAECALPLVKYPGLTCSRAGCVAYEAPAGVVWNWGHGLLPQ
jgi:hypothetical protein